MRAKPTYPAHRHGTNLSPHRPRSVPVGPADQHSAESERVTGVSVATSSPRNTTGSEKGRGKSEDSPTLVEPLPSRSRRTMRFCGWI